MIVKPAALMVMAIGIYFAAFSVADPFRKMPLFIKTAFHITVLSIFYLMLLLGAHVMKGETHSHH